jgi:hypothetical protein
MDRENKRLKVNATLQMIQREFRMAGPEGKRKG